MKSVEASRSLVKQEMQASATFKGQARCQERVAQVEGSEELYRDVEGEVQVVVVVEVEVAQWFSEALEGSATSINW